MVKLGYHVVEPGFRSLTGVSSALQNPKVASLKVEDLADARFVRMLDESGFIDRVNK